MVTGGQPCWRVQPASTIMAPMPWLLYRYILRELLKREIGKVQKGLDPLGVIRDPAQHVMIETGLTAFLQKMRDRRQAEWQPGAQPRWTSATHP